MGIFDRFKGKTAKEGKKQAVKSLAKSEAVDTALVSSVSEKKAPQRISKEDTGSAHQVLLHPQITEKATMLSTLGKYVFRVSGTANKSEIRKAIEKVYDVHVTSVHTVHISGKRRRYGRTIGRTRDWKKAIVTLAQGERIEGVTATETA